MSKEDMIELEGTVVEAMPKTINITIKKTPTTIYCLLRYAFAPERMDSDIFFILSVPSENFKTFFAVNTAKSRAATAPIKVNKIKYFSKKLTLFVILN